MTQEVASSGSPDANQLATPALRASTDGSHRWQRVLVHAATLGPGGGGA